MTQFVNKQLTEKDVTPPENPLNFGVYLKPTPKNEYYRFRLLWFRDKTDRKTPFVTRFVHEHWENREDGPNRNHSITCPTSSFAKNVWQGDAFKDCPVCRFSGNNFIALKESGYKDKIARTNYRNFKRKFQAVIPVYVVNDPHYDPNNGKFKVLIINESDIFEKFKKLVISRNESTQIFNGGKAVDFLVRSDIVEKVLNEGEENEYRYTKNEIVQMGFSNKPYEIANINKENIDEFPFGDVYYSVPDLIDLQNFYKKWCLNTMIDSDDIDDSDMADLTNTDEDLDIFEQPKKETKSKKKNSDKKENDEEEINIEEIDTDVETEPEISLIDENEDVEIDLDIDELDSTSDEDNDGEEKQSEIDIDSLLDDIGI